MDRNETKECKNRQIWAHFVCKKQQPNTQCKVFLMLTRVSLLTRELRRIGPWFPPWGKMESAISTFAGITGFFTCGFTRHVILLYLWTEQPLTNKMLLLSLRPLTGTGNVHTGFREGEPQPRNNFLDWRQGCRSIEKGKRALPTSLQFTVGKPTLSRLRPGPGTTHAPPKAGLAMARCLQSKDQIRPLAKMRRWHTWYLTEPAPVRRVQLFRQELPNSEGGQTKPKVMSHPRRHRFIWIGEDREKSMGPW